MQDKSWEALQVAAHAATDPAEFRRLARELARLRARGAPRIPMQEITLAIVGRATRDSLAQQLDLALLARGIFAQIQVPPYSSPLQQLLDSESDVARSNPRFVLAVLTTEDVPEWPDELATASEASATAERAARTLLGAAAEFHARVGAEVLLDNFPALRDRPLGNLSARAPGDRDNFLRRLNLALGDLAPPGIHIVDAAGLAALHGAARWRDSRLWYEAKQPIAHDRIPEYVRSVASVIAARLGLARKCLVLDLDETLWGGVVGDVGVAGIELGEGTPRGEAFKAFQQHVRALRERGVLLAVCSKNEPANARAPFEQHPESVLRVTDFAAFRASWDPKSDALRAIANDLALPPSALVFVDDNPAEREQVRRALPEVAVIELPADPADYAAALDASRWFEAAEITSDDRARATQYERRAEARALADTMDLSEFLASLEMRARLGAIDDISFARALQLANKTNQFNLTTRRFTEPELRALIGRPETLTLTVRLADRFGDHGLVGVLTASVDGDALQVEDWLMSCRVLKRGVEHMLVGELAALARERGLTRLRARFVATGRNELVRSLLDELGFTRERESQAEVAYSLDLGGFEAPRHFISVVRGGEQ